MQSAQNMADSNVNNDRVTVIKMRATECPSAVFR